MTTNSTFTQISDLLSQIQSKHELEIDRYESTYVTSSHELITLSCTLDRVKKEYKRLVGTSYPSLKLTDTELKNNVLDNDRKYAYEIMSYYGQKLTYLVLKGNKLSDFRRDLNIFLHLEGDHNMFKYIPIAYRLPELYYADMKFDKIKEQLVTDIFSHESKHNGLHNNYQTSHIKPSAMSFQPLEKIQQKNKYSERVEYWLKDDNNYGYVITLDIKNPLLAIWDRIFYGNNKLPISGFVRRSKRDFVDFFSFTAWDMGDKKW